MSDKDELAAAKEAFDLCAEAESDNRKEALDDLRFARLGEQWPQAIKAKRERDQRPVLTINRLPSFIRQVVNDSRQNRPQIKVKPVDDGADRETAEVMTGLIRSIEYRSKAEIAYDTAVDFSATMGFGYFRIGIEYEYEDSFRKTIQIKRVSDPFMIYGDPHSTEADSSDWNMSFVTEYMTKTAFEKKWKGAERVNWQAGDYADLKQPWRNDDDNVLVCEFWERDQVAGEILMLSDDSIVSADVFKAQQEMYAAMDVKVMQSRPVMKNRVRQKIMTGAEVLETNDWAGCYIPIVPVYGEEINIEGKRYFRSMIRDAKDAQRMYNYWRTTATELVALAPRVPFVGEEGAFDADPNWETANSENHPYLQYTRGSAPPQRQPLDSGPAAGSLSEAMQAGDDLKSIMGLYDASLGAKSNETSGRAIMARQREGDNSTFHIIDNLARSIRHGGTIIVDLIPKVFSDKQMLRILGEDGSEHKAQIDPKAPPVVQQEANADEGETDNGEKFSKIYNLGAGKYDVAVDVGPGYTTRREEARVEMTEALRSMPELGAVAGDLIVKAFDWPQAEEIADRIKKKIEPESGIPPELQQMIEQGQQELQRLGAENEKLKLDLQKKDVDIAKANLATQKASMPQPVEIPEQVGMAMVQTIAPAIAQAVALAMSQPKRKIPVRDQNGMIVYVDEMPVPQGSMQ